MLAEFNLSQQSLLQLLSSCTPNLVHVHVHVQLHGLHEELSCESNANMCKACSLTANGQQSV